LIRKKKATLLEGLPVGGGFAIYYRRGMPEFAIARDARGFLKRADRAFAAAPVRAPTFSSLDLDGLGRVIASGYLKRVESLSLIAGTRYAAEELPRMARALAASPDVAGLRRLALHYAITAYTDTDEIVTELAAGRHWHSLTAFELDMRGR